MTTWIAMSEDAPCQLRRRMAITKVVSRGAMRMFQQEQDSG